MSDDPSTRFGSPEQAFPEAVGRFGELLRGSLGFPFAGTAGLEALRGITLDMVGETVRRVREAIGSGPSFPIGAPGDSLEGRTAELAGRWAGLQERLGLLWNAVAHRAAAQFASRIAVLDPPAGFQDARRLYGLLVDCAEEAYAATAGTEEYSRLQAALINTMAALRVEWRQRGTLTAAAPRESSRPEAQETGCSLREPVWRRDKAVLYRYLPLPFVSRARGGPVLISYALVNRPYVLDLQPPDPSLIRRLLASGLEVYLIDWGYPDDADRDLQLSDYIRGYLGGSVRHILKAHRTGALTLAGVCQGGTLGLCYCALNPGQIANLVLLGTPVDFHTPDNLLSRWARDLDAPLLARAGNLPGASLTGLFLALSPFRLMHRKHLTLMEQAGDAGAVELFGRMERWILDSPDQAALAFSQFLRWFYQENRLVRGTLEIGRRTVDLKQVRQPILNIYAKRDHIVPPSASIPLGRCVGSKDYTEYPVDAGHIGLYVSSRARDCVPARIASWLGERAGA